MNEPNCEIIVCHQPTKTPPPLHLLRVPSVFYPTPRAFVLALAWFVGFRERRSPGRSRNIRRLHELVETARSSARPTEPGPSAIMAAASWVVVPLLAFHPDVWRLARPLTARSSPSIPSHLLMNADQQQHSYQSHHGGNRLSSAASSETKLEETDGRGGHRGGTTRRSNGR